MPPKPADSDVRGLFVLSCRSLLPGGRQSTLPARPNPLGGFFYMPRLTTLKPRLLAAPVQRLRTHQVERTSGRPWMRLRARLLSDRPLCVACEAQGRVAAATELDHVVPLWKGGSDDPSNLQGLCAACHATKTAQEAGERGA